MAKSILESLQCDSGLLGCMTDDDLLNSVTAFVLFEMEDMHKDELFPDLLHEWERIFHELGGANEEDPEKRRIAEWIWKHRHCEVASMLVALNRCCLDRAFRHVD